MSKFNITVIYTLGTLLAIILGTLLAIGFMHSVFTIYKWSESPKIDNFKDCEYYIHSKHNPTPKNWEKQFGACKILFPKEEK